MSESPGASSNQSAISTIRETTKWLVTIIASLTAALVGTVRLHSFSDGGVSFEVVFGVCVFLVGILCFAGALVSLAGLLLPFPLTIEQLASEDRWPYKEARTVIEQEKVMLIDYESIGELARAYEGERKKQRGNRNLSQIVQIINIVVSRAGYEILAARFRWRGVFSSIFFVIGAFFVRTSGLLIDDARDKRTFESTYVPVFTVMDQHLIEGTLGFACKVERIRVAKIGETDNELTFVSLPQKGCPSRLLVVEKRLGQFVPWTSNE